ncbi:MAG TPA: hypothetical protein VHZ03_10245 [Trebonia sp.]|nr:hypothetical protein [Trebonia sp.]
MILALDFFTADLLNDTKVYVLAAIEHGTRRVRVLGVAENPVQCWVVQLTRNLVMDLEDAGVSVKFVLHDRDASFTAAFDAVFQAADTRTGGLCRGPGAAAFSQFRNELSEPVDQHRDGHVESAAGSQPQGLTVDHGSDGLGHQARFRHPHLVAVADEQGHQVIAGLQRDGDLLPYPVIGRVEAPTAVGPSRR